MNQPLIDAATNALRELKHAHEHHYPHVLCFGRHLCPVANAIAELEAELDMAQMLEDPAFQPFAGIKVEDADVPKMINPPLATIDPSDLADAIIRAKP